jgi:anthranilate phosphoribosyltransferase
LGVYDAELTEILARVLQNLGSHAAYVVHGHGGLDELTTTGPNQISCFGVAPGNGDVVTQVLDPGQLGFHPASEGDLKGGTPRENAGITRAVLEGQDCGPRRDVVLLNAGAALVAGRAAADLEDGVNRAAESIDSGAALRALNALVDHSQRAAGC